MEQSAFFRHRRLFCEVFFFLFVSLQHFVPHKLSASTEGKKQNKKFNTKKRKKQQHQSNGKRGIHCQKEKRSLLLNNLTGEKKTNKPHTVHCRFEKVSQLPTSIVYLQVLCSYPFSKRYQIIFLQSSFFFLLVVGIFFCYISFSFLDKKKEKNNK